jgi:ketosteroid isomerase-like protein
MNVDDRLSILERIGEYSQAWDGRDSQRYALLFTEDGVFEIFTLASERPVTRQESRAAILAWARAIHDGAEPEVQRRHHQSGTVFDELTPDTSRTRTMVVSTRAIPGEPPHVSATGVYHDEWRKTSEGWRIARRSFRSDRRDARPPGVPREGRQAGAESASVRSHHGEP